MLVVTSEHTGPTHRETRLTLISVTDPAVRVLTEDIAIQHETGRRKLGQNIRLDRSTGEALDLLIDWQAMPGSDDHDAGCLKPLITRRFRLEKGRYTEVGTADEGFS